MIGTAVTFLDCLYASLDLGDVFILSVAVKQDPMFRKVVSEGGEFRVHIGFAIGESLEHVHFLDPKKQCFKGIHMTATNVLDGYALDLQTNEQKEASYIHKNKVGDNHHVAVEANY